MRLLELFLILSIMLATSACGSDPVQYQPAAAQSLEADMRAAAGAYERNDVATAVRIWKVWADKGNAEARTLLGAMYWSGEGVPRDHKEAARLYLLAANQGYARAQNDIGFMLGFGEGIPPHDDIEAYKWLSLAIAAYTTKNQTRLDQARKDLATLAARMTPAQITEAERRARLQSAAVPQQQSSASGGAIPMKKMGGTYVVPVLINNAITLDFTVDSGASDVSIPADVVTTLMRAGTILNTDFIGEQVYVLADGTKVKAHTFRIRSLKVGDRVLENVTVSIAPTKGSLLLGQSFLGRFKSWSIDNNRHVLVLE